MEKIYTTNENLILIGSTKIKYVGPRRQSNLAAPKQPFFQLLMGNVQIVVPNVNSPLLNQYFIGKMTSFEKSGLYPMTLLCQVVAQLIQNYKLQPWVPGMDLFKTESHELPKTFS